MSTTSHPQYMVELPKGVPIPGGHFGTTIHKPSRERYFLFFQTWDLLFLEKGQGSFQLRDQKRFHLREGYFLLLPPSIPIWLQCFKPACLGFCHFSFDPIADNVFPSVREDCLERDGKVLIPWIFSKKEALGVWRAYRQVVTMKFDRLRPWRMACAVSSLAAELGAFALSGNLPENQPLLSKNEGLDPRIIDVCRRIARNPFFPWKVSELATSVGISTGHLDRMFRSNLQSRLKGFIIERRLQGAVGLLDRRQTEGERSIKEISAQCGFSSQHFFSRQFKKVYGVPPSKYKLA